ncbi:MAG: TlpA disulfide reductase family protein [Rhodothermales bacterium]
MHRFRSLLALVVALAFAGCQSETPPPPGAAPAVDAEADSDLAPDFTLTALDGSSFTLSEHRGEVVVLNFWATWCLPCLAEMPTLEALQQELGDEGLQIVGISQDTGGADEIRPFADQLGVTYPLLPDPAFNVSARYGGVPVLPTTIVIDRNGRITQTEYGALTRNKLLAMIDDLIAPGAADSTQTGDV